MWNDPIIRDKDPGKTLGGNLQGLNNYCCIRVSHALMVAGHKIDRASEYKDKNQNKYIIKVETMKDYLRNKFGEPTVVTEESAQGMTGIICFDKCGFSDATGHFDLWNESTVGYAQYWATAKTVYLWDV